MSQSQHNKTYYDKAKSLLRKLFFKHRQQPINTQPQATAQQPTTQENFDRETIAEQKRANEIGETANNIARESNRISKTSTIVNSILLGVTVIAVAISGASVYIANKAIKQTDSSLAVQKAEFEIENRPFLQALNIRLDTFKVDKGIAVSFDVINMGKFPAKIKKIKSAILSGNTNDYRDVENPETYIQLGYNAILSSGVSFRYNIIGAIPLTEDKYKEVYQGSRFVYLAGEITYININDKNVFRNEFVYKLGLYPTYNFTALKDTIIEIGQP